MAPTGRLRMCQIRNYCELDQDTFFSVETFFSEKIFSATKNSNPARNPCSTVAQGYFFFPPCPYLAIAPLGPSRPSPSPRGKELFREQRGQRLSEELTFSLFLESDIQGQHLFSPRTILKLQNHHWQKAFITSS